MINIAILQMRLLHVNIYAKCYEKNRPGTWGLGGKVNASEGRDSQWLVERGRGKRMNKVGKPLKIARSAATDITRWSEWNPGSKEER